jgi:hypothetical protein
MPAEQTSALTAGQYQIVAELEVRESSGWNGRVRSVPAVVTVIEEPAQLTAEQQITRGLLLARAAGLRGKLNDAAAGLVELAVAFPDSVPVLRALAEALEAGGMPARAYDIVLSALDKYYAQHPERREPPASLLALRNRIWNAITPEQ